MCLGITALNLHDPVGVEEQVSIALEFGNDQMKRTPDYSSRSTITK